MTSSEVVLGLSTAATAEQWKLHRCLRFCSRPTSSNIYFCNNESGQKSFRRRLAPWLLCSVTLCFCIAPVHYVSNERSALKAKTTRAFQVMLLFSSRMRPTSSDHEFL